MHSVFMYMHMPLHSCAGVPDLEGYQNYGRELARSKQPAVVEFETRADILTYMRSHALPSTFDEMDDTSFYAVDGIADIWSDFVEPDGSRTLAVALISKQCVAWIGQLIELLHAWALHGDGKHKLHIGSWILMTFGTHCLKWEPAIKGYRHSFRPLIYLFSKNHESVQSGRCAMVAMQIVSGAHTPAHMHTCTHASTMHTHNKYITPTHACPNPSKGGSALLPEEAAVRR